MEPMSIILLVITSVVILFVAFATHAVRQNSVPRDDGQNIFDPKGIDDGMALLVYQPSKSGHIDAIAQLIAEELFKNGYKVVVDRPSIDLSSHVSEYDLVILGSNVYVGQLSSLLIDYATNLSSLKNKTLGLFSNGKLDSTTEFSEIEQLVKGNPRVVTAKFVASSRATDAERVHDFVQDLLI